MYLRLETLVCSQDLMLVTIFQKLLELDLFDFILLESSEVWSLQSWNVLNLVFQQCLVV